MKKMKKAIAVLSTAAIISSFAVPAFAAQNDTNVFVDIKGHWAKNDILDLVKMGLLSGMGNNKFEPNANVTREQFASMIARTFHITNQSTGQDFEDVASTRWSFNTIEATKDYMDAYRSLDGNSLDFRPAETIDRQDVTVTFVKVLMKYNSSWSLPDQATAEQFLQQTFSDAADIAPALRPYVAVAVQKQLIHGDKNGKFAPLRNLNRGEVAALLHRVIKMGLDVVVPSDMSSQPAPMPVPVPVPTPVPTPAPAPTTGTETVPSTGTTTGTTDTTSSVTTGTTSSVTVTSGTSVGTVTSGTTTGSVTSGTTTSASTSTSTTGSTTTDNSGGTTGSVSTGVTGATSSTGSAASGADTSNTAATGSVTTGTSTTSSGSTGTTTSTGQ